MPSLYPNTLPDLVTEYRQAGRDALALRDRIVDLRSRYTADDAGNALANPLDAATAGVANAGLPRADFIGLVTNLDAIVAAIDAPNVRGVIAKGSY